MKPLKVMLVRLGRTQGVHKTTMWIDGEHEETVEVGCLVMIVRAERTQEVHKTTMWICEEEAVEAAAW